MPIIETPNDPLFGNSWHLSNSGTAAQGNGTAGIDIHIRSAWQKYTGKGILVGVLDDGVEITHPDLLANVWTRPAGGRLVDPANGNLVTGLPVTPGLTPGGDNHGTPVAGVIAAVANNGLGSTGVAPDAKISSYRLLGANSASNEDAFNQALYDGVQVLNNSWGYSQAFVQSSLEFDNAALAQVTQGRGGLGNIIVFAEGNYRGTTIDGQAGLDSEGGLANVSGNRFTIAVAAITNTGIITDYSSRGSNLLVSAPGGAYEGNLSAFKGVVATDRVGPLNGNSDQASPDGDYTGFNGTSAAAPIVSGVAALILEANPRLGYRDVQEIFAYTARQIDPGAGLAGATSFDRTPWVTTHAGNANGGGLNFSTDYGFGLVDAGAAVRLAETWTAVRTEANLLTVSATGGPAGTVTNGGAGIVQSFSTSFTVTQPAAAFSGLRVDRVEVDLALAAAKPSELTITLTSPDLTTVTLMRTPGNAFATAGQYNFDGSAPTPFPSPGFTLATPGFWGEKGVGTWTLTISAAANATTAASFTQAELRIFGDSNAGGAKDLRLTDIITDDFSRLAGLDASRASLGAGKTTLNAAAMTGVVQLDLGALEGSGGQSVLGGQAVTLVGQTLTSAFGGAGDDTLLGNTAANALDGGWGNDLIRGGAGQDSLGGGDGDDVLDGGTGADLMSGGMGDDVFVIDDAGDSAVEAASQGVDTVLVAVNGWAAGSNIEVFRLVGAATQVTGGAGNEQLVANAVAISSVNGGTGDDTLWAGGSLAHTLDGGAGDDILRGLDSTATMIGGTGDDQFVVGNVNQRLVEAAGVAGGNDTAWILVNNFSVGDNIEITRLFGAATAVFGGETAEQIVANPGAGSQLQGRGGNDVLWGSAFADNLYGGAGDDIIRGQGGADAMFGGLGDDQFVVLDGSGTVVELAGEGDDTLWLAADGMVMSANVERLNLIGTAHTGFGNDTANIIIGNATLRNDLRGNGGDDVISGGALGDAIYGGGGNDVLYGMGGADFFFFIGGSWGQDLVFGFTHGQTKLGFSDFVAFSALTISSDGVSSRVDFGSSSVVVAGIASLSVDDFVFG